MWSRFAVLMMLACGVGAQEGAWRAMFDGKSMEGWKATPFRGAGVVKVDDGKLLLGAGNPMTGANYTAAFPKAGMSSRQP